MDDDPDDIMKGPPKPPAPRDERGRLLPGAHIGGSGRAVGLVKLIAERTRNGQDIAERFLKIWEGNEPKFGPKLQLEAGKWLGDRFWGKAIDIQAIAHLDPSSEQGSRLRGLASDALLRLAEALNGKQLPPSSATIETTGTSVVVASAVPPKDEQPP